MSNGKVQIMGTNAGSLITTSLRGRRLGLQKLSTADSGGSRGAFEFLTGEQLAGARAPVSTSNSTSTNVHPFGVQFLPASTAGSSQVYTLDPPIPGVPVTLVGSTVAACLVKTANSETIRSSKGSSATVLDIPASQAAHLVGLSTSIWGAIGMTTAAGFVFSTTT